MSDNPYVGWAAASDDDEGGAFAVPTEVTWNNGFGDEDLAGGSPARLKPAPRPAPVAPAAAPSAPVPAPVATPVAAPVPAPAPVAPAQAPPVAPARPLVADTEVPEWASYRPTTTVPPVAPATPPAAPVAAPVPAPAAPAPAASAPSAPQQPARPAADLAEPEWARHRPTEQAPTPVQHAPAPEPTYAPEPVAAQPIPMPARQPDPMAQPVYAPEPEQESRRGRKTKPGKGPKGAKSAKGPKPTAPGKGMAGGRWKVKVLRVSIYSVVGLLLLGGLKNVVLPASGPDAQTITDAVRANLGDNGFPTAAAEGFAVRFAQIYLATDPATQEDRLERLAAYSPDAADGSWGWTGSVGKQDIIAGPVVASKPVLKDKNFATVTVTAQVTSKAWVYLAVPVYASETGSLVVAGPPAFVAPPARADSPGDDAVTARDDTLEGTLGTALMPGYFKAWAASNSVELDRYTAKDATPAARNGLAGAMTLDKVGEITMPRDGGDTRVGEVEVTWNIKGAGTYIQNYVVTVSKDASAKWSVKDITGGVISDGSSGAEGAPTATATASSAG